MAVTGVMKSGLGWGKARMQFLAILPEVTKLLQEGCSKRQVFCDVVKDGRISMSYPRFCQLAGSKKRESKAVKEKNSKGKGKAALPPSTAPAVQAPASAKTPAPAATDNETTQPDKDQKADRGPIVVGPEKKLGFADLVITDDQIF